MDKHTLSQIQNEENLVQGDTEEEEDDVEDLVDNHLNGTDRQRLKFVVGLISFQVQCVLIYLSRKADHKKHGAAEKDPVFDQCPFDACDQHHDQRRRLAFLF